MKFLFTFGGPIRNYACPQSSRQKSLPSYDNVGSITRKAHFWTDSICFARETVKSDHACDA